MNRVPMQYVGDEGPSLDGTATLKPGQILFVNADREGDGGSAFFAEEGWAGCMVAWRLLKPWRPPASSTTTTAKPTAELAATILRQLGLPFEAP